MSTATLTPTRLPGLQAAAARALDRLLKACAGVAGAVARVAGARL